MFTGVCFDAAFAMGGLIQDLTCRPARAPPQATDVSAIFRGSTKSDAIAPQQKSDGSGALGRSESKTVRQKHTDDGVALLPCRMTSEMLVAKGFATERVLRMKNQQLR